MKTRLSYFVLQFWCVVVFFLTIPGDNVGRAQGVSTRFAYEGTLTSNGTRANGPFDFTFTLYNAAANGNPVGTPLQLAGVTVTNGNFGVVLDFGIVLSQAATLWLELAVRPAGGDAFTVVPPRQSLAASAFAIHATYAANLIGSAIGVTLTGNTTNASVAGNSVAVYDANQVLTNSPVTPLELSYLVGVAGPVQAQFNGRLAATNGTASNLTVVGTLQLPAARASSVAVFDAQMGLTTSVVSAGELASLAGVRNSVQVQLDALTLRGNGPANNLTLQGQTVFPTLTPNRLAALNGAGVLTNSSVRIDEAGFLSGLQITSVKAPPYLAVGDGVVDDTAALQQALNDVAARGSGVVYLPRGLYKLSNTLLVGANTRVVGAGRGVTILRGVAGAFPGQFVNGANAYANIAMVGIRNSSVESLTVDNRSNGTDANGISMLPDGVNYAGTPCARCSVMDCEVFGFDTHQYLIWNLRGTSIRIVNNYCDGGVRDFSGAVSVEGIESFGGSNVVIRDNTVLNTGVNGINIASHPNIFQTGLRDISVVNNFIKGSYNGIWCNTSLGVTTTNNLNGVHILNNFVDQCQNSGFYFSGADGTSVDDMVVSGNVFRNTKNGIYISDRWLTAFRAVVISDNSVLNTVPSISTIGIVLDGADNTRVSDNTINNFAYGIYLINSTNTVVANNRIEVVKAAGIYLTQGAKLTVKDNRFTGFNLGRSGGLAAIVGAGLQRSIIVGNSFVSDFDVAAVRVDAASNFVLVRDNQLLYPSALASPIVNLAGNANIGLVRFAVGAVSTDVSNGLVNGGTQLRVVQENGAPVAFRAQHIDGGLRVTLARAAVGDETFRFEILP